MSVHSVKYVSTFSALASALKISRTTLWKFRSLPDCPKARPDGRHSVQQWAAFISAKAERITTGDGKIPLSIKDAVRIELLRIQIERQKLLLDAERKALLPREEIIGDCLAVFQRLDFRLRRIFDNELPARCVGIDEPIRIQKIGRKLFDAAMHKACDDLKAVIPLKADTGTADDREQFEEVFA